MKDGEKTTSVNNVYADDRGLSTSNYSTGIAIDTKPWYNSYDANGYPVKCIAPNGNERLFTYDECGNIASIQNGSQSEEIFYNFDGQISKHNKYINGRLEHSINYGYDNLERLTSKTIGSNITKYAYDNLGNLTSVTSPSGFARTYSYDRAERLVQLDFDGKTVSYDYNADGTVKKITYPNGITTEYVYDDAKRATSVTTKLGSSVKEQYSYTYDGNGNVLSVSGTKNISYTYDNLNRLKSYTENGVTTVYTYDKRNNLISEICGSNVKTYEYSGDNRLSKTIENDVETVYEYDLNGNLIRRGNDEFAYDEDNKLVYSNVNSVETTYKIGVDGLRSSKTTAGISTDYSIDEAGNVISEGSEEIIIGHMAVAKKIGSSYYYYLYNAHGDVTALTDSTGEIVNNYSYDPWGRIISQTENVPNDIKYAGEYQDSETGLIYLRNRYYDPAIGRFITEDPVKDRLNWYAYCGNNPIRYVDPWGLIGYDRLTNKITDDDIQAAFNELSSDTVAISNGEIYIAEQVKSGEKPYGTELVKTIVDLDDYRFYFIDNDTVLDIDGQPKSNVKSGVYNDKICINVDDLSRTNETFKVGVGFVKSATPMKIVMAHEMIHVYGAKNGFLSQKYGPTVQHLYYTSEKTKVEVIDKKEAATVGFPGNTCFNPSMTYGSLDRRSMCNDLFYTNEVQRMNENLIRDEQGIPRRLYYRGY